MINYHRLAQIALVLAVIVIMLGAYTRLTNAGLGCPDWPGCYGHLVAPAGLQETAKAWTEMVHRYIAGILGVLILILAGWAIVRHRRQLSQPMITPFLLIAVLIFQAVLGMWTVTLKLLPLVVTAHLLGGMTIAALLCWLAMATSPQGELSSTPNIPNSLPFPRGGLGWGFGVKCDGRGRGFGRGELFGEKLLRAWLIIGLLILIVQLFLGAWTSTNYAALACGTEFPGCHGVLFPPMDWQSAFNILSPVGPNYEGGRLEMMARVTIQMAHRYWALITFIYLAVIALVILLSKPWQRLRYLAAVLLILLGIQVTLGILNVVELLPLAIAVAHNGVAVLLLITTVALLQRSYA